MTGLDHVVIMVNDMDAAILFWTQALGARIERRVDDIGLVQLRAGTSLIDLVPRGDGKEGRNMEHVCVRIGPWDEQAIRAHLDACGIEAGETEERYGAEGDGPSIYIEDGESNRIELKGPLASGSVATRAALSSELEASHAFLDEWLMGACAQQREVIEERLVKRLEPDFSLISITGKSFTRDQFVRRLERNYALTPSLRSEIRYVRLISDAGELVVASYEDWRRDWDDQSLSDDSRISTVVFRRDPRDPCRLRWVRLHHSRLPD